MSKYKKERLDRLRSEQGDIDRMITQLTLDDRASKLHDKLAIELNRKLKEIKRKIKRIGNIDES